jgi:hypothetical protein
MPPSNGVRYEMINPCAPIRAKYLPQSVLELRHAITPNYASPLEAHLEAAIDHFHRVKILLSSQPVRQRYRQFSRQYQPESSN